MQISSLNCSAPAFWPHLPPIPVSDKSLLISLHEHPLLSNECIIMLSLESGSSPGYPVRSLLQRTNNVNVPASVIIPLPLH